MYKDLNLQGKKPCDEVQIDEAAAESRRRWKPRVELIPLQPHLSPFKGTPLSPLLPFISDSLLIRRWPASSEERIESRFVPTSPSFVELKFARQLTGAHLPSSCQSISSMGSSETRGSTDTHKHRDRALPNYFGEDAPERPGESEEREGAVIGREVERGGREGRLSSSAS